MPSLPAAFRLTSPKELREGYCVARIIGTPGESAAGHGGLLVFIPAAFVALFALPLTVTAFRRSLEGHGLTGLLVTVTMIGVVIFLQRRSVKEIWEGFREGTDFLKGARGEILVHQALLALPDEYIVFHDFHPRDSEGAVARWNVDHIVVGPNGVFVLDAKYYRNAYVPTASKSPHTAKNVKQAQRNAMDLKSGLTRWSAGELSSLFVVPIVVYAQPDARVESFRDGSVRTLPLRLLMREILNHSEHALDQEKAGRIARVLFSQIAGDLQYKFKDEFDSYGTLSNAARMVMRDERLAAQRAATSAPEGQTASDPPTSCPFCGAPLMRKMAKQGGRAGKPFLGCTNYPKTGCRYGFNIEE